jgi:phosphoribosyl 1,2-cyclic phosphodiesterase
MKILRFLGVGTGRDNVLGCASAVVEENGEPVLMIDAGFDAPDRYVDRYGSAPSALFITHAHLDHISGMEKLFGLAMWSRKAPIKVYCHFDLVPILHHRLALYPGVLAEGGTNFWDAFHLVPVGPTFWHAGVLFHVVPTQHHQPGTSHGLALKGAWVYTSDTRPIPEILVDYPTERIVHDCGRISNPSHTGLEDLSVYSEGVRQRLVLNHYATVADGTELQAAGYAITTPGCVVSPRDI